MITAPGASCPGCGQRVAAAVQVVRGAAPPPSLGGQRVVCASCGHVGVFVDGPLGLFVREATMEELQAWAADPAAVALARKLIGRGNTSAAE